MLQFMHRYQKYIFVVITVIIVISFSFFGTYSPIGQMNGSVDEVAFVTYGGEEVKRSELEKFANFIATDQHDSAALGAFIGPNFLNDGVIQNDFLASGLADVVVGDLITGFSQEWRVQFAKERRFTPYRHHEVDYLTTTQVWNEFAPQLRDAYATYKRGDFNSTMELYEAKKDLYLAERAFPQVLTKRVLVYQMQQQKIPVDQRLRQEDLSLFGYHTLSDWFGRDFVRLFAQLIFNLSEVAEERGYVVTRDEAIADLSKRSQETFNLQKNNPDFAFDSPGSYMQQQLRNLGLDLNGAAKFWQRVLLFRKLFSDVGAAAFVDQETLDAIAAKRAKVAEVVCYQLPKALQISQFREFCQLETYLEEVAQGESSELINPLEMSFKSDVVDSCPELALKRLELEMAHVDSKQLYGRVGLKRLWSWQLDEENFKTLQSRFPELGIADNSSEEARLASLDKLSEAVHERVDQFSRKEVVAEHPEWAREALAQAPMQKVSFNLYADGGYPSFVEDPELVVKIKNAEVGSEITHFTEGDSYRLRVLSSPDAFEVATFDESRRDGQIDKLLANRLTGLGEKEDQLKELFRSKMLKVQKAHKEAITPDLVACYRMLSAMEQAKEKLDSDRNAFGYLVKDEDNSPVQDQFKLVARMEEWNSQSAPLPFEELLSMEPNQSSEVQFLKNGASNFFLLTALTDKGDALEFKELTDRASLKIAGQMKQELLETLLGQIEAKGALQIEGITDEITRQSEENDEALL